MVETEINNYINKKCYDCCHFKKENMELYKMNLPNGIVNNIIDYSLDEEDVCRTCQEWRDTQAIINGALRIKRRSNRNVEDDILIFLAVYNIPPSDYVRAFMKISEKKYEMIKHILWMLEYQRKEREDVKEHMKIFIESEKFNAKITVRDINIIFKMMYERSKMYQLTYYPEFTL